MTTLKILSVHNTLAEAVVAAKLDLSYNPTAAANTIAMIDGQLRPEKAFVTDCGVYYTFQADVKLFNKFEPFMSCMSDAPFSLVEIGKAEIRIGEATLQKSDGARKLAAKNGWTLFSN